MRPRVRGAAGASYVEWGAVFAGALTAAALSFVLLTFGAAIGLSMVSPWPSSGVSARTFSALAVFWTVAQQIGAFLAGGYVAGRMRARWADLNADEVEFRDGMHGALVWALGIVIGAMLIFTAAGAATRAATDAVTKAASVAALNADPLAYYTDTLLRPGTARPAAAGAAAQTPRVEPIAPETKAELTRIVSRRSPTIPCRTPTRATSPLSCRSARDCRKPRPRGASPTPMPRRTVRCGTRPTRRGALRCSAA